MIFPAFKGHRGADTGGDSTAATAAAAVAPDLVAYGSAVSCCQRRWRESVELLEQMRRGGEPDFMVIFHGITIIKKTRKFTIMNH